MREARRPLVSILFAAAIPILLFGSGVAYVTAQRERDEARSAAAETVERVAERVASEIATQIQIIQSVAGSAALDRPDLPQFYRELERLKAMRPLWETIELADVSGTQLLNLLRPEGAPLGPTVDRDSFDEVIRTGRPAVGGIGPVGPISGKRLVALRVPVAREGQLRYVLTADLVPDGISAILRRAGVPKGWIGTVVDGRGRVIARTPAEETGVGHPANSALQDAIARTSQGFYYEPSPDGGEIETVYRTLADTGRWSVHIGVPKDAMTAPIFRSLVLMTGGIVASLALAAGLAVTMTHDIAQRIRDEELRAALALKESEARGAVAAEAAELGTWRWDFERDQVSGSERFRSLLGLPPSAPAGGDSAWPSRTFLQAVHPGERKLLEEALRKCLSQDVPLDVEFRTVRPDGGLRWVRLIGRAPRFEGARPSILYGVISDIEPHRRAEAERLDLLRRLAEAQENEQRRIARELHDQVGQTVTGLSLGLKGLQETLGPGADGKVMAQLRWLRDLVVDIGRDIHRAAMDLRPTALDDLGLHKALLAYVSEWSERYGINVDVQAVGLESRPAAEVETVVYRVIQEALTNVLKHARARNVSVVLEQRSNRLRVVIEDDGIGFHPEEISEQGSRSMRSQLGLSGIRERLSFIGGSLHLESAPGGGTAVFLEVPLAPSGGPP